MSDASDAPTTGTPRNWLGPAVRRIRNLLSARATVAYAAFPLRPGGFTMMSLIHADEGCSQSDLARETALDKSAVMAILDDLQSHGLISRERSTADRRRHRLALTDEGRALFARMQPAAALVEQPVMTEFTDAEFAQLMSLLDRARLALERSPLGPPTSGSAEG